MAGDWDPETDVSNEFLERLPPEILETFTPEQRAALWGAAKPSSWRYHPIDIRLSLPLLRARLFLAVVSGIERRSSSRRRRDIQVRPLFTAANIIFLVAMFVVAVALGSVLTDVINWLADRFSMIAPAAKGVVVPK